MKEIIRNSNYLDESYGRLNDVKPTVDVGLGDFTMGLVENLRIPMITTFVYNRALTARLND